jgi:hypothetical protein
VFIHLKSQHGIRALLREELNIDLWFMTGWVGIRALLHEELNLDLWIYDRVGFVAASFTQTYENELGIFFCIE